MATKKKNKKDKVEIEIDNSGINFKKKGQKKGKKLRFRSKLFITIVVVLLVIAISFVILRFAFPETWDKFIGLFMPPVIEGNPEGDLAVHFVDVGQGDCIIIQLPDGKNAIIDAGGDGANVTEQGCWERIEENIDALKIKTFDYMILTHTDGDHVDYMDSVLDKCLVKQIYRPAFNSLSEKERNINPQYGTVESKTYDNFIKAVEKEVKETEILPEFNIGKKEIKGIGYQFDIFGVEEQWYLKDKVGDEGQITAFERNKVSPMVLLSYNAENATRRIMFTGDAEGADGNGGEELFLEQYGTKADGVDGKLDGKIDIDLLKIGHHGSESSASVQFLEKLDPEYAVVSVGTQGKHGHPRKECLDRLANYVDGEQKGIKTYMTKDYGDIIFRVNKQGEMSFATDVKK